LGDRLKTTNPNYNFTVELTKRLGLVVPLTTKGAGGSRSLYRSIQLGKEERLQMKKTASQ
jgi:hypothetical protein